MAQDFPEAGICNLTEENFSSYNLRNIYSRITDKRSVFLGIDALDMVSPSGVPYPCMKVSMSNIDLSKGKGERAETEMFFIPLQRFLLLCNEVLSGSMAKRKSLAMKSGAKGTVYFEQKGGGKNASGEVMARRFSIVDGLGDAYFAFLGSVTPAAYGKNGSVVPTAGAAPKLSLFMNMPNDELKEFCLIGQSYAQAYIQMELQRRLPIIRNERDAYTRKRLKPEEG